MINHLGATSYNQDGIILPGITNVDGEKLRAGLQGRKNTDLAHAYIQC